MPAKLRGLPVNDLAVVLKVKRNTLHIEGNHKILPADASHCPDVASECMFSADRFMEAIVIAIPAREWKAPFRITFMALLMALASVATLTMAQTDCATGDSPLDNTPPKNMSPQELIQKFTAAENRVKEARSHYTFTQDVLVQTLNDKAADGQWHEVTRVSYDAKGKRVENVAFSEVSTLRDIQISSEDMEDIRVFMQWILTSDQLPDYTITYAGQQHVDDLDTYVFHVVPVKEEKNKRYFQGRIWVDNRDLQVVKLCGKSVPEQIHVKKHQPMDVRPTFVGYRQYIDGLWFPAYARVDDTLHFQAASIHVREVVKFKDYAKVGLTPAPAKP